ncbi:MAG: ATP-binding protein [Desulfobacterales bacterium]|nr:ATP-binding protein [Desulfobacterales bacterium]
MIKRAGIRLSLKNRVYLINTVLLCVTVIGAGLMIWYTFKTEKLFRTILDKNVAIYQTAESLSTSLVSQKGYVSYYLLDGNPAWIEQYNTYKRLFSKHLATVTSLIDEEWGKKTIALIESKYEHYISTKDKVLDLYKKGEKDTGAVLHKNVRVHFSKILELCEEIKAFHKDEIDQAINKNNQASSRLRFIAVLAIFTVILLSLLINFIFARHILWPIRQLAEKADREGSAGATGNEVIDLKKRVNGLIENAEQTHKELARSRETLMQSEKMALIGKLAAGTAHSIRNPLTSVKMRLFSLNRSCRFTKNQQEDFNVISGEIKQINRIVQNFLEFARPPKLRMKKMSPSTVVDNALRLLDQRLRSYGVSTRIIRNRNLAETFIDPEQLKEVIVNIIINACEAVAHNGIIVIHEEEKRIGQKKHVDIIKITDDGPGIPSDIREDIFTPFFTTKEEGTGLGLSIAFNVVNEHGGWLDVSSRKGTGTSFVITLPVKDS